MKILFHFKRVSDLFIAILTIVISIVLIGCTSAQRRPSEGVLLLGQLIQEKIGKEEVINYSEEEINLRRVYKTGTKIKYQNYVKEVSKDGKQKEESFSIILSVVNVDTFGDPTFEMKMNDMDIALVRIDLEKNTAKFKFSENIERATKWDKGLSNMVNFFESQFNELLKKTST